MQERTESPEKLGQQDLKGWERRETVEMLVLLDPLVHKVSKERRVNPEILDHRGAGGRKETLETLETEDKKEILETQGPLVFRGTQERRVQLAIQA